MKYIICLLFTALVYGQSKASALNPEEEMLCSIKTSVFTTMDRFANRFGAPIVLNNKKSVNACKEKSGAKVFKGITILADKSPYREALQLIFGETNVEKVNYFYANETLKFYDGFEFDIQDLNETMVDRLVKERSHNQVFSLAVYLSKWSTLGSAITKYAAKIHHVVLITDSDEMATEDIKSAISLAPELAFYVRGPSDGALAKELARAVSASRSRKVGYLVSLENDRDIDLTYTADI